MSPLFVLYEIFREIPRACHQLSQTTAALHRGGAFGLLGLYTDVFLVLWFLLGVRDHGRPIWSVIIYTIAFICFEQIARVGVDTYGYSEFWFMLAAYLGFAGIILWRGNKNSA